MPKRVGLSSALGYQGIVADLPAHGWIATLDIGDVLDSGDRVIYGDGVLESNLHGLRLGAGHGIAARGARHHPGGVHAR